MVLDQPLQSIALVERRIGDRRADAKRIAFKIAAINAIAFISGFIAAMIVLGK